MNRHFRILSVLAIAGLLLALVPATTAQEETYTIAMVAGVIDPFYQTMERGARQAAADLGVNLIVQVPDQWDVTIQTPMVEQLVARGDLDFMFLAPVDKDQMIAPLERVYEAGIPLLTVDTFIGDGDYVNGPVTFPLSYIGSDNVEGGCIAAHALAEAIGGAGKVYVQNVVQGISTTDQREEGFRECIAEYPDIELIGVDYNGDDAAVAAEQTAAVLEAHPDLAGVFGTNVFSAQGAGTAVINAGLGGEVQVVAFDATEFAIEQLREGTVSLVIAQKPYDMGYLAVEMAIAHLSGVTSIPPRIPTGYAVITRDNMDDPEISRYFYSSEIGEPEPPLDVTFAMVAGVIDPFYQTMERGARQAAADLGVNLIVQVPDQWDVTIQTPMVEQLVARGDLDFMFLAPVDKDQMIAPLERVYEAGIPLLTVDTFIGDGDYVNGPVTFPLSYIGSDNVEGGCIAAHALAEAIGGAGKVYVQNVVQGISTTDQREEGFRECIAEYPDIELIGVDYNGDDAAVAAEQTAAVLEAHPDLAGVFGTNVFSAQGAGTAVINAGLGGEVQVVAFDATEFAIEQLREGTVSLVIAQKPYDMGYLAVEMAIAHLSGVTSIPPRIPTGYAVITRDNMDDPNISRFFYTSD